MVSVLGVSLTYPPFAHSQKGEELLCVTWGYTRYPQDLALVTTNTYIK
ncbi:hypothetical protein MCEMZLE12_00002 [actinobacterium SCGC AAA044-D11]